MKTKVISRTDWVEIYYDENNNISDIIYYTDTQNIIYPASVPFVNTRYMLQLIEDDIIEFLEISLGAYDRCTQKSNTEPTRLIVIGGTIKIKQRCLPILI